MRVNYSVVIPARNEEHNLRNSIPSLLSQTLKPYEIIVVNDGSTDGTAEVAESYGCKVVNLPYHRESWVYRPKLSVVFNAGVTEVSPDVQFFMILGADTLLAKNYAEKVIRTMIRQKWVIASGVIKGELTRIPRGSGRFFFKNFWDKYVGKYPYCWSWESYPIYKALSLGLKVGVVSDAYMFVKRKTKTKLYLRLSGFTFRELGYTIPYIILKIGKWLILETDVGVDIIRSYLAAIKARIKPIDPEIARWIKYNHAHKLLSLFNLPYFLRNVTFYSLTKDSI